MDQRTGGRHGVDVVTLEKESRDRRDIGDILILVQLLRGEADILCDFAVLGAMCHMIGEILSHGVQKKLVGAFRVVRLFGAEQAES